jgi:glycosidase
VHENTEHPNGQVFKSLQRMIAVRKHHSVLVEGSFIPVSAMENNVLCYIRETEQQRILALHNLSDQPAESTLQFSNEEIAAEFASKGLWDLLSDQIVSAQAGPQAHEAQLHLEPYQALWLKLP